MAIKIFDILNSMFTYISHHLHTLFEKIFGSQFSKEGFITYAKNMQWTTVARIITLSLSLVTTIIVARVLGPDRFGTLNYVLSISVLFSVIANLGIDNLIYKELITRKEDREVILGSAMALKYITGIIACLSLSVTLFFLQESVYIKFLAFALSLSFLTQPLLLLTFDFLSNREMKEVTYTQIITSFISNSLKVVAVLLYGSLGLFIAIIVIENIIAGSVYLYFIQARKRTMAFLVSTKEVVSLFKLAIPLTLFSAFYELYSRIDQIMLKHYLDEKAVGLYAAAVRLTDIWNILPNIFFGTLFPAFVNTVNKNTEEYKKRLYIFLAVMCGILGTISVVTFFISPFLIRIVYGPEYYAAAPLLSVYVFSLIGSVLSMLIIQDLFLHNKLWFSLLLPLSTAVINILLNLYLIPTHGALGAALATAISYNLTPFVYVIVQKIKTASWLH